jgi:integrase/recombinase XerD
VLDRYFSWRRVVERLRRNVLGPRLEDFADYLAARGGTRVTIGQYVREIERFGSWLEAKKIRPRVIQELWAQEYLDEYAVHCRRHASDAWHLITLRAGLRQFMRMLRERGELQARPTAPLTSFDLAVETFSAYLRETCGLAETTCRSRSRYVHQFLESKYGCRSVRYEALEPTDVMAFVANVARKRTLGTAQVVVRALRSFLRFLQSRGACNKELLGSVPRIPTWRETHLPKALPDELLGKVLGSFDRSAPTGRRDYAMALCMSEVGLRVSEVAQLGLKDIDWRRGTLCIRGGKSRRTHLLPLSRQLGQAIADYLRDGRPRTSEQKVFVRHRCPVGTAVNADLIRAVMRRTYAKLDGWSHSKGTHVLRHTFATRLHRNGASLKEVADILGHRSLDSTVIYTQVDVPRLLTVVLPWPEVQV